MENIINSILELQEKLQNELHEIFNSLGIDYSLLQGDIKALNNSSYKFFHKQHGLLIIDKVDYGFDGYDLSCRYMLEHDNKTNAYVYLLASVSAENKLYCIDIGKIGTCFAVEKIK